MEFSPAALSYLSLVQRTTMMWNANQVWFYTGAVCLGIFHHVLISCNMIGQKLSPDRVKRSDSLNDACWCNMMQGGATAEFVGWFFSVELSKSVGLCFHWQVEIERKIGETKWSSSEIILHNIMNIGSVQELKANHNWRQNIRVITLGSVKER